jgi:protein tyrosine phosphatase
MRSAADKFPDIVWSNDPNYKAITDVTSTDKAQWLSARQYFDKGVGLEAIMAKLDQRTQDERTRQKVKIPSIFGKTES